MSAATTPAETCIATASTPGVPGAIAVITLVGDVESVLRSLTGRRSWPVGAVRHETIDEIDDPVIMRPSAGTAILTPHGGPQIVARLLDRLGACGALVRSDTVEAIDARWLYPEASDLHEARMLSLLAGAASPLALPLLLDQPRRWRDAAHDGSVPTAYDFARSRRLDRLLIPPRVAIVGPPNAGKSTLFNRLVGRTMAIASDEPGTTRDHVAARVEMAGLVVDLIDTPGLRATDERIERAALDIAAPVIAAAELIVALAAPEQPWPALASECLDRVVRVGGHADRALRDDATLCVSGIADGGSHGVDAFMHLVRDALVPPADLAHPGPWWSSAAGVSGASSVRCSSGAPGASDARGTATVNGRREPDGEARAEDR